MDKKYGKLIVKRTSLFQNEMLGKKKKGPLRGNMNLRLFWA